MWTYTTGQSDNSGASCCITAHLLLPLVRVLQQLLEMTTTVSQAMYVDGFENSVYYLSDPLWDGNGCSNTNGCCGQIGMPWFYKRLPRKVTDDFEVRICKDKSLANVNIAIEKLELYVCC